MIKANTYAGNYKSGIVRAKKILITAGFPWSKTTGRYHPFANTQTTSNGVRVTRVGCSGTIALHVRAIVDAKLIETLAIVALRDAGLNFDERGWLDCENSY